MFIILGSLIICHRSIYKYYMECSWHRSNYSKMSFIFNKNIVRNLTILYIPYIIFKHFINGIYNILLMYLDFVYKKMPIDLFSSYFENPLLINFVQTRPRILIIDFKYISFLIMEILVIMMRFFFELKYYTWWRTGSTI